MTQSIFSRHKILTGLVVVVILCAVAGAIVGVFLAGSSGEADEEVKRHFSIDYEADTFLMDGKPFRYVAGSFHYFRALPETWRQKFKTMRAGGLNAVDVYVQWALHNPEDGVYHWDGIANVEQFVQIATEEDLYVILRPGPYICAEIENGGLPYWLESKYPGIRLRVNDANYFREVEKWYAKVMPQLEKHMYGNGGNIIMVQIENEYGAYTKGECDVEYKNFLRDETRKYTGDNAVLFTVDWPYNDELKCGAIEGVFITTDFGLESLADVTKYFAKLREVQPHGPLVNSEFYAGWFTLWQGKNGRRNGVELADTLRNILLMGASVNFYMYFGGTNFGFWAGADVRGIGDYIADITSYDYDAPMDEAGNPTEKYMIFRNVIKEFMEVPDESTIPAKLSTMSLHAVDMKPVDSILSTQGRSILGTRPFQTNVLHTFEQLGQFSGFVLYETTLPKLSRDPSNLIITGLRDRALVYIDHEFVGVLSRENAINTLPISAGFGSKLSILVENQGRLNFAVTDDYKGILGTVRVQTFDDTLDTFETLIEWTITGFPFDNAASLERLALRSIEAFEISPDGVLYDGPVVFQGEFEISVSQQIQDTYWDTQGWGKGFIFVNGFNLGRYWPLVGPQITMYIPKDLLKHGKNQIQVVELQKVPPNTRLSFVSGPIFINDEKF